MKKFPRILNSEPGIQAVLDETRLLFQFKNAIDLKEVENQLKDYGLIPETLDRRKQSQGTVEVNNTEDRYWMRSRDREPISDEQLARIETKLGSKLKWIGPVYHFTDDMGETTFIGPLPNVLLIRKKRVSELSNYIGDLQLKLNEPKSKFLNDFDYFELPDVKKTNSYAISDQLHVPSEDLAYETMPMVRDWCVVPTDTLFPQQWDMTQIQGPQAWDISTGINTVTVAVLDSGVDLTHPDLVLFNQGIDLGDMMSDGSPNDFGNMTGHGTSCSGIVASAFNNGSGVAGIAGNCRIIPIAIRTFSNVEIANGINWAVSQGASSISMSFGTSMSGLIDTALSNAFAANVVLCAATGNSNAGTISYPARNPNVMAIGASDQIDERKSPASPDGEGWGSQFGTQMSVVAPGVLIPTTDMQGNLGFNPAAGAAGDYVMNFNGTSSATPHVAGLAALIKSQYPAATSTQIRNIIERTAQKTGATAYTEVAGKPNGSWNNQLGYGRINAFRALDFANAMIRDWTGDAGVEPSSPPGNNFWSFSDIVTRFTDDDVFDPTNVIESKRVERGQTNYIYVRVTNLGPRDARNVNVNIRITPYVGLEFVYPNDWTLVDAMHVNPTAVTGNFATVASGSSVIAKFTISAAQVEELYGWENSNSWHPCLLAQVTADNDYSYSTANLSFGNIVLRKNDFAQRNLTVVNLFSSAEFSFAFVAGSRFSKSSSLRLHIDRSKLPAGTELVLETSEKTGKAFPLVDFTKKQQEENDPIIILERTKVKTRLGGCSDAVITLEKGSRIVIPDCNKGHLKVKNIKGGSVQIMNEEQQIQIREDRAQLEFGIQRGELYPMAVRVKFPSNFDKKELYNLSVYQVNENEKVLGGATVVCNFKN